MSPNVYLLDANVLIAAKNSYYGFEICPGFWDVLLSAHKNQKVFSVVHVQDELMKGDDDLVHWVDELPKGFFLRNEDSVADFGEMQRWAAGNAQYTRAAKEQFARVADCWLMAVARTRGFTVVTHERLQPEARSRIPIPNVCKQFSIHYLDTFAMLKAMRARFRSG